MNTSLMQSYSDDIELLQGLKRKEDRAYSRIFDLYARQLVYFVERVTQNTQVAQDLATESFIKVFERTDHFDALPKLKSFLFTVANNAALDWLKSEGRRNARLRDYDLPPAVDAFEKHLIGSEIVYAVYQEIENLPPQVREVVRLSIIEEKSLEEIATQMNIAYKTVQNHKTKGFNLLRIKLLKNHFICIPLFIILEKMHATTVRI